MDLQALDPSSFERGIVIVGAGIGKTDMTALLIAEMMDRQIPVLVIEESNHHLIKQRVEEHLGGHDLQSILLEAEHYPVYIDPIQPLKDIELPTIEYAKPIEHQTPLQSLQQRHGKYRKRKGR